MRFENGIPPPYSRFNRIKSYPDEVRILQIAFFVCSDEQGEKLFLEQHVCHVEMFHSDTYYFPGYAQPKMSRFLAAHAAPVEIVRLFE
jgi:hypothetical protein